MINSNLAIKVKDVSKTFHVGIQDIQVLKDISLQIKRVVL